ncbi:hypothetical protein [Verminephrobacter eiseniae]|nr:hypothetical protein [Verminephrobacter eiseniae]
MGTIVHPVTAGPARPTVNLACAPGSTPESRPGADPHILARR